MSLFYLVRHARTDAVGKSLAGRKAGVHLSQAGKKEVADLAEAFSTIDVTAVFSSPLARAMETAAPIAHACGLETGTREGFTEIDYGDWTGREIASLEQEPEWIRYNRYRSRVQIPGGERLLDVQARSLAELEALGSEYPQGILVVVSHEDVIKALLLHYLGASLDFFRRVVVEPASVSAIRMTENDVQILYMNRGSPLGIQI